MKTSNQSNSKQIMLIVLLVGLVFVALTYFLVFTKYNDKANSLKSSNRELKAHVDELKKIYDDIPMYEEQKEYYASKIKSDLKPFPAAVREEDGIMLAVRTLPTNDVEYTAVSFTDPESYYTVENGVSRELLALHDLDNLEEQILFTKRVVSYTNKTDYKGLKGVVTMINDYEPSSTITNVTYSRNAEENILEGTIETTFYSVYGDGKTYTPVDMQEYQKGLQDLFNLKEEKQPVVPAEPEPDGEEDV